MLEAGKDESEHKISSVNLSTGLPGGEKCNLFCSYCTYGETLGKCERNENVLEILQYCGEKLDIKHLDYACGEITISPHRYEIIKLWKDKGWNGRLLTNGVVFVNEICDLICDGSVVLNISLDAGNGETFSKIKGVDCFEKVVGNIEKYAQTRQIELKYIILDGINNDDENIDGFSEIAKRVNAHVMISRDNRIMNRPLTESEFSAISQLVDNCISAGLGYTLTMGYMNKDFDRLERAGLLI